MKHEDLPCKGKFCGRTGLPILPLIVSYVPDGEDDLPVGMHSAPEFMYQSMKGGRYQLRVATQGFVWVLDHRRSVGWRCFAATPSGRFRELPLGNGAPDEPPKFNCSRDGHNLEASLIDVPAPDKATGPVWVAYSRAWWTDEIRRQLKTDAGARRQVMMEIDAKAIHAGGAVDAELGFRVDVAGAKLQQHVLEYRDAGLASHAYARTTAMAVDRVDEATPLAERMYDLAPSGGIVLALRDPVGVIQDISKWRNSSAGKLAEFKLEQKNLQEYVVADLITGLKGQLYDAGQYDQWRRYAQHVDMGRVQQIYAFHERKVEELAGPIPLAAEDWAYWIRQPKLWAMLDTYDATDRVVAGQLEDDVAVCIDGAGAIACEQDALDTVLAAPVDGKHQALWLAYAGGDSSLVAFLASALAGDRGLATFKDMRALAEDFKRWLEERTRSNAAPVSASTAMVGRTLGAQLSRLAVKQPEQATRLRARVSLVAAARMDIAVTAYRYEVSAQQLVQEMYEANWGPAQAARAPVVRSGRTLWAGPTMHGAWIATQVEVEATITIDMWLPEAVEAELAAKPAAGQAAAGAAAVLALPAPLPTPYQGLIRWLRTLDGPVAGLGAVLSVGALTSALQDYFAAGAVGDDDRQKKAAFGIASGVQGVLGVAVEVWSGVVKARVSPGLAKQVAGRLFVQSGLLSIAGGAFAVGSAVSEGVYLWSKGQELLRSGDDAAGDFYRLSGLFFGAAGVTAAATAVIQASAAFAAAGLTAASGGLLGTIAGAVSGAASVLMFIPVWGWIALGLAALAAGLYLLFRGREEVDTPIEQWLSRTVLRKEAMYAGTDRTPYESLDHTLHEFNQAVFKLTVKFDWLDEIGRDRLLLHVVLPGYDADRSRFAYQLTVAGPRKEVVVARRGVALSRDPDLQLRPPAQASMRAAPERSWLGQQLAEVDQYVAQQASKTGWMDAWEWVRQPRNAIDFAGDALAPAIQFQVHEGYAVLSTQLLVEEDDLFGDGFDRSVLKFEYWPDAVGMPSLMVSAGGSGINYEMGRD